MNDPITEYAVRTTYRPAQSGRVREFGIHLADARNAYEVSLHGEEAVEFLMRQVARTAWVAGKLPPPVVDRDGGLCDPLLHQKPIRDAGSIDTWPGEA